MFAYRWRALAVIPFLSCAAHAQDIHFSQFFNTPLALTPAQIGAFDGAYRLSSVYRQQWRSVTQPFRTFGLGGDAKDAFGVRGLGAGLWLFNDRAGDSRLNTFHMSAGASYTMPLGEGHALSGGMQLGFTSLSIDRSDLRFDVQYNGYYYDPALSDGETFGRTGLFHPDLHAGVMYRYTVNKREWMQAGFALFNLTTPAIGFLGGPGEPLDRRGVFHFTSSFPIGEKTDLLPMAQFMAQGTYRELNLGGAVRFIRFDRYGARRALRLGGFYRAADAGYLYGGLEYDAWDIGISYDINVSDLVPASRYRGAWEITAVYIFGRPMLIPRFKACPEQL
ncbi:MAG: PorP/SprF family type IX secretion system membrane protein [Flavobacteriales bacterium]|nr:PorP/SprF family type IX secretion system membrane protein [Flavobacteriales bacterium]